MTQKSKEQLRRERRLRWLELLVIGVIFIIFVLMTLWFLRPMPLLEDVSREVFSEHSLTPVQQEQALAMANSVLREKPELFHQPKEWRRTLTWIITTVQ